MSEKNKLRSGSVLSKDFNEKAASPEADSEFVIQVTFEEEQPSKTLTQSFAEASADQQSAAAKKEAEIEKMKQKLEASERQKSKPGPDRER